MHPLQRQFLSVGLQDTTLTINEHFIGLPKTDVYRSIG